MMLDRPTIGGFYTEVLEAQLRAVFDISPISAVQVVRTALLEGKVHGWNSYKESEDASCCIIAHLATQQNMLRVAECVSLREQHAVFSVYRKAALEAIPAEFKNVADENFVWVARDDTISMVYLEEFLWRYFCGTPDSAALEFLTNIVEKYLVERAVRENELAQTSILEPITA